MSYHEDKYFGDNHTVSTPYERDWHSPAWHWTEGLKQAIILTSYRVPYPCVGFDWNICWRTVYFVRVTNDRWTVEGTHTEEISGIVSTRKTYATGCNF